MADLDFLSIGQLATENFLKMGQLTSHSWGKLYDLKYRPDLTWRAEGVHKLPGGDTSGVYEVVRAGGRGDGISVPGATTPFGELSVAQTRIHCGWSFPYGINPIQVRKVELFGGVVSSANSFAELSTGTAANGVAFIRTNALLTYTPGIGAVARFTAIFDTPQDNSQQLIGIGNFTDGFFFGYDGLKFGILLRRNGNDSWVYQDSWNVDKRPDLDFTKGNVFEIAFQWLGFGMQYFRVEDDLGNLSSVHNVKYANKNTDTSLLIPSMPVSAGVSNNGNTTNITLKTPSAMAGTNGEAFPVSFTAPFGYSEVFNVVNGQNYLFTLYNPEQFNGIDNRLYLEPRYLRLTTDGSQPVRFIIYFGAILTNPVYEDIEPLVTPAQIDTQATAFTNGFTVFEVVLEKVDSQAFNLIEIFEATKIWPENNLTVIAEASGNSVVTASITNRGRV